MLEPFYTISGVLFYVVGFGVSDMFQELFVHSIWARIIYLTVLLTCGLLIYKLSKLHKKKAVEEEDTQFHLLRNNKEISNSQDSK